MLVVELVRIIDVLVFSSGSVCCIVNMMFLML